MTSASAPVIDEAALAAIDIIPSPVWILDRDTLRFLAVNEAAAEALGYSIDALLQMTIDKLRLPGEAKALRDAVVAIAAPVTEAGRWRLRRGDGKLVEASTRWRPVSFQGRDAVLATWHDVLLLRPGIEEGVRVGRERDVPPELAEAEARLYRALFDSAPGKLLVLAPGTYEIIAASDAFLDSTNTRRDAITGRRLFEVFPDDPADPGADGVRNLRSSLQRVERKRTRDVMAVQRHPIPRPASEGGGFEERFWSLVNSPVLDPDGELAYIIQRVEDVTELEQQGATRSLQTLGKGQRHLAREILLRSGELGKANRLLEEQAATIRTAERLADLGTWSYDPETRSFHWSERARELYGIPPDQPVPDFDGYVAMVHPEDRDAAVARYREFEETGATYLAFQHRIVRSGGEIVHVRGVGERHPAEGQDQVVGFVQDITEQVVSMDRLSQATRLMRMAGERAKLGGWLVNLDSDRVQWTDETAAIHEEAEGKQPTLEEGLGYYTPEARDVIRERFNACASDGTEYDEILELDTAKGNRIWVRAMGEPVRDSSGTIVAVQGAFQDITEVVEARQKVAALEHQLRETLQNMGDAFMTIDHDWTFTFVNKHAEALLDHRREDLLGRNIWDAFPQGRGSTFEREYERVQSQRTTARFTEFYPPLGRWFRVNAYPAPDGIAVYFNDITEERRREQQLRLLEAAVSRLNDIVLITEAHPIDAPAGPIVVYVNDAIERVTGYSREELLGSTPRILQGPATDRDALDRLRKALEEVQPVRTEIVNYNKSGEPFWLELDIVPLANDDGEVTHFVAVERDVTERKRTDEAIRVRDERFRLLSRATSDAVWDWDLQTDAVWWNDALSTLFGHDLETVEPNSESWRNRIHPDDRDEVVKIIHQAIEGSALNWVAEYRFLRADGQPRQVVDRGFIIRDTNGTAVRMLGGMIDITEQRELEMRYRQAQKLEAVGQLTGGVAHDFNNLLTVILGNAEILAEELIEPEHRSLAAMTVNAAERGAELTRRLLAFSRRQALAPEGVDLNRRIGEMQALLRRTLREDIEIQFLPEPDLWTAEADPAQLESALLNLVLNSRDAMPDGGRLTIKTANVSLEENHAMRQEEVQPGPYVLISIADSGAGMPPDVVERAFEPFFTTKEAGSGSGLGLSMVYGFAKQSGGQVIIESELGRGTTVKLFLPKSDADPTAVHPESRADAVRGGRERILVVEDDAMVMRHLVSQLRSLGYLVESARNGPEALERLREKGGRFDLLMTDVFMPGGMNGRELADICIAEMPGLRVLFTSGYTENTLLQQGRLDESVHLLAKPYRRQELAEKVRHVLDAPTTPGQPVAAP